MLGDVVHRGRGQLLWHREGQRRVMAGRGGGRENGEQPGPVSQGVWEKGTG